MNPNRAKRIICTFLLILSLLNLSLICAKIPEILKISKNEWENKYSYFPEERRLEMLEEAKKMFTFGYDAYMKYAFPMDELDPIHCTGRGPDYDHPENININDVLGDYSLTLVDVLDTLAVMGNRTEFQKAVKLVLDHVSFDKSNTVQVFEANIRVLGGLLSAHLLIEDTDGPFGHLAPDWYSGELLTLAHDLADRLIVAFDQSEIGLPHPRVNLREGVPMNGFNVSCTAGAGSLLLEFGMLSRLLGDPVYESLARRAVKAIWNLRDHDTGLFGNVMNIHNGEWVSNLSGLGAGMDSFYEYLLKSYILFEEKSDLTMFTNLYANVKRVMRKGRPLCNEGQGPHPFYVNVDLANGNVINHWIDSLQAAFPGVQVLHGDIDEAVCHHAIYYAIWKKYGCLPERFNWKLNAPDVKFYPLRPEFIESTYLLYQATKSPFYLHVGMEVLQSLNNITKVECGYATVHDVETKTLEDRQESFFLSETCKYLYLLFDKDNPVNKFSENYLFTTEGHVFPIRNRFSRQRVWEDEFDSFTDSFADEYDYNDDENNGNIESTIPVSVAYKGLTANSSSSCHDRTSENGLPLQSNYFGQLFSQVGADFS